MKHRNESTEQNDSADFFENLILFVLLIFLLLSTLPGCAGVKTTAITTGSDNATVMTSDGAGLTVPELIHCADLAEQEALTAWQLYESTKDATALGKLTWWLQYSAGVAARIEALSATGS